MCAHMVLRQRAMELLSVGSSLYRILERTGRARYRGTCQQDTSEILQISAVIFFYLAPSSRRDCALQDKARAEHRVTVKRCKLGTQPLPARRITVNGYNPAIENCAEHGRFAESEPVWQ